MTTQAGLEQHAQADVAAVITAVMELIKHGALVLSEHRRKVLHFAPYVYWAL